jgi:hypothetical protein
MDPKSDDLDFLASINAAIYSGMATTDPKAIWVNIVLLIFIKLFHVFKKKVMQTWLLTSPFWNYDRVQAFLSKIPIVIKFAIL